MRESMVYHSRRILTFGHFSCPFICATNPRSDLESLLSELEPDHIFLITDEVVSNAHGSRVREILSSKYHTISLTIPPGESCKNLSIVNQLCENAVSAGATRRSLLVALGGGVVGNTAGVVAGLLFRGIRLMHMPTTLLAASDSVISLKQAVNGKLTKNNFGLYHEPCGIVVDCNCLDTLPYKETRSGLAELIKNSLAIAPETIEPLLDLMRKGQPWGHQAWGDLIAFGIDAKCRVMIEDPFETKRALILEYGHTVGHAIELADAQSGRERMLSHGECVVVGMRVASRVAVEMGFADQDLISQHETIIDAAGLRCVIPYDICVDTLMDIIAYDNKRGKIIAMDSEVPMVLLESLGRPVLRNGLPLITVPKRILRTVLDKVFAMLQDGAADKFQVCGVTHTMKRVASRNF